jgi:hypothetical protein
MPQGEPFVTTVYREEGDDEVEILIEGVYYAGHPGTMYARNGDPGDPPEPPEIDVHSARRTDTDAEVELTEDEVEGLYETVPDELTDKYEALREGAALAKWEARRDGERW